MSGIVLKNITLYDLRKRYTDNGSGFFIRIREKEENSTEKAEDIVYYNGIKALKIDNSKLTISLFDNIYKLNRTNMKKSKEKIVNIIANVRKDMKDYFPMILNKITLKKSKSYTPDNIKLIISNIIAELKDNNLDQYFDEYFIEAGESNIISTFEISNSYDIKLNTNNVSIENLVKIEEIFKRNAIFKDYTYDNKSGLSKPEFNYVFNKDVSITNFDQLKSFEEQLKKTICSYEENTRTEMEKKYQHEFMISNNTLKKFKSISKNLDLYRFEEEYYTSEANNNDDDRGKIDCVFIDKKTNQIYMIELKVDETVVGGTNGIHKHLIDIEKMLKDNTKKENFIKRLEERYNNRRKVLEEDFVKVTLDRNLVHFWTIIAFTNKNSKKIVEKMITDFENDEYYTHSVDNKLPSESKTISKHFDSLKKLNCDAKILYDNDWNKQDLSEELFEEVMNNE